MALRCVAPATSIGSSPTCSSVVSQAELVELAVGVVLMSHPGCPRAFHASAHTHRVVLTVVAVLCMLIGLWQVRRGLNPIEQLRRRLGAIRDGHSRRIDGVYPSEVQPLVDDLNLLLEHREAAVARAVAKAGDLAHGLKTPLGCWPTKPIAPLPPATPTWPLPSNNNSIGCGARPTITWRRPGQPRRARSPVPAPRSTPPPGD